MDPVWYGRVDTIQVRYGMVDWIRYRSCLTRYSFSSVWSVSVRSGSVQVRLLRVGTIQTRFSTERSGSEWYNNGTGPQLYMFAILQVRFVTVRVGMVLGFPRILIVHE